MGALESAMARSPATMEMATFLYVFIKIPSLLAVSRFSKEIPLILPVWTVFFRFKQLCLHFCKKTRRESVS